jgi:hypothetical protein
VPNHAEPGLDRAQTAQEPTMNATRHPLLLAAGTALMALASFVSAVIAHA